MADTGPDPLAAPLAAVQQDFSVNTLALYATARAAVAHFALLPASTPKTFLYTGNMGNTCINPIIMTLGGTKAASWYLLQNMVAAYKDRGYRFYFVDERTPAGKGMRHISGKAHAEEFRRLAEEEKGQGKALWTFVRGKGYVEFEGNERVYLPAMEMGDIADYEYGKEDSEFVMPKESEK